MIRAALLLFSFAGSIFGQEVCARCHADIAKSYAQTGMGRSFSRPSAVNQIEDYQEASYFHEPSDTHFEMFQRDGQYFQRQYQTGYRGVKTNVTETPVDFVIGSGDHARTYLHRRVDGQLIELPLGWYAEKGGFWAMNPGYDRPDHAGLSRVVPDGCMFCHNAYPQAVVEEGIDCQRCHGAGAEHIRTNGRAAIVNPARLSKERQFEVCLQCHLEPNGGSSSNLIVRYERQPFSYQPGEPLSDFRLHFDQPKTSADRFEIVGAGAYRLMQSQCFIKSNGAMTCTTCHDPHRAEQPGRAACLQCHAEVQAHPHAADPDCIGCHMPKRRTQDAVHVVMTDHLIQRYKPEHDLLPPIAEVLHSDDSGPVVPFYPKQVEDVYLGVAQVQEKASRAEGIARLLKAKPARADYYLQLGDALRASRRYAEAIAPYQAAVRREPESALAHLRLGLGLTRVREFAKADEQFRDAERLGSSDAAVFKEIGLSYLEQNRMADAAAAFQRAIAIDPGQYEAHNGLGGARLRMKENAAAETEFRAAIQIRPHYAEAHHNLAYLLGTEGRYDEARYHFEESLKINPGNEKTRADFAAMVARMKAPAGKPAAGQKP